MNDVAKIGVSHLHRTAYVYLRQSSPAHVEHNRESTERQYALASKAAALGWPSQQVVVIDEDLGVSGTGVVERSGFARLITEVALGHVGIVLGLEVSRLARNNADWYRLLDLCGLTDTLIGDGDGIYHPALFNDRLLLGLKGTMSEAESHVCERGCSVAFATRRLVANYARVSPSVSYGAMRMARSAFIPMNPSARRSEPCSHASPSSDRPAACGSGSAANAYPFLSRSPSAAPSAGSTRATSPSIMCSRILST